MSALDAASVVRLHTILSSAAFSAALLIGCALHYKQIVKNDVAGYPEEWFPSVSATIGDWYPERNVFQILIALTAGPRFALVFLQYYLHFNHSSGTSTLVFLAGIIRTLSCGGWVFVTSTDSHDVHDVMMVLYIVCNLPWMLLGISATPFKHAVVRRRRKIVATLFFATLIPLVYFFMQHKVHRVPGAYTRYAFFEWGLIFLDISYDSLSEREFREARLQLKLSRESLTSEHAPIVHSMSETTSNPTSNVDTESMDVVDTPAAAKSFPEKQFAAPSTPSTLSPRALLVFASDVYLAYVFWTLLTALIPTFFYFSVWELSIAGHEFTLLAVLSPLLLSFKAPYHYLFPSSATALQPTLLNFVSTASGQTAMHIASLIGLVAYAIPSPGGRLLMVAMANSLAVIRQVVLWAGLVPGAEDVGYQSLVFGLAVLGSSVAKQANRTNNPIWPFVNHKADGYNELGISLALLASYVSYRSAMYQRPDPAPQPHQTLVSPLRGALPLGSLVFTLHNLFSESSTIIAWSWTGYEDRRPRGPLPHVYGSLTITAMALGLLLASFYATAKRRSNIRRFIGSSWWFLFGAQCMYVMYAHKDWTGFAGGLGVALFVTSIIPLVFEGAASAALGANGERPIVRTYTTALFTYCLFNVAAAFTVAYAFVPGGIYLRERSDLILAAQLLCLLPSFQLPIPYPPPMISTFKATQSALHRPAIRTLCLIFPILSLLTTLYRLPKHPPQPFKPATGIINAGIWTVHFGIDNEGHDSQKGMAQLINDMQLDIVGLLETDLHRTPFANRDLTRYIVENLNYNVDIGPGPNAHTWGAALLTKFPIISTKHHLLPSPDGELAPAIEAILDIYGTEVLVLVSHNGQEETPLDRELQSTELARIMSESHRPVIFLGYLVTKPLAPRPSPYGIMVDEGNVFDIDDEDLSRWCEYILYRGLYRTAYARVSEGIITDTELQIGQFLLPRHGHQIVNASREARYLRSWKENLPSDHWFPMAYYGNKKRGGVNGHFYHVFNTPLYYRLPEGAVV